MARAAKATLMTLDPTDPVEAVVQKMIEMNRKKRADYAADDDVFSNFRAVAEGMALEGFGTVEACEVMIRTKLARITSLRLNGRADDPANETLTDTVLDLAVYAAIMLALLEERAADAE